jgi:hypothetical protein
MQKSHQLKKKIKIVQKISRIMFTIQNSLIKEGQGTNLRSKNFFFHGSNFSKS